jgi:orotidine-5'-phosphate decarboxylase
MNRENFIDKLIEKVKTKKSHIVIGLDPNYDKIPFHLKTMNVKKYGEGLTGIARTIFDFNRSIIDAVFDLVPAIKPQIAFYEQYGIEGLKAFKQTVQYGKKRGLIVIEDAKRNDIGTTASAYSSGHIGEVTNSKNRSFRVFDLDAITVNPYLGSDGIMPFIRDAKLYEKGVFVLVKTSNPSSTEFQNLTVTSSDGRTLKLYELIAEYVRKWGEDNIGFAGYSAVGAVVGATFPEEAKVLRKLMPKAYFLVPGYGVQGGKVNDVLGCFNKDGYGALISASRSIIYAYQNQEQKSSLDFIETSRNAVIKMNDEINQGLKNLSILPW